MEGVYGDELRFQLAPGEQGISESLAAMAAFVDAARSHPAVKLAVARLRVQAVRAQHPFALELYDWIVRRVKFKPDPTGTETVRHPAQLLTEIGTAGEALADCDCVAVLAASILAAAGYEPVWFVVGRPGDLDAAGRVKLKHIYYGVRAGLTWVPFDPQEGVPPGMHPPKQLLGRIEQFRIFPRGLKPEGQSNEL